MNECAEEFTQGAEEARRQQRYDACRYYLRHGHVDFKQRDQLWVWSRVRRRGLPEKLLRRSFGARKVLLPLLSDAAYEVILDGTVRSTRG